MPVTPKALADGQLPNTKTTLYTAPGSTTTIVKTVSLVNTGGSAVTVNLYVRPGATSRRIIEKDYSLAAGKGLYVDNTTIILEAGDLLEGDASTAAVVDFYVGGVEQS